MPRKPKSQPAELPTIPQELLEQFGNGPMTAETIHAASLAFKKALIERALGGEMSHHLGYPSGAAKPATGADDFSDIIVPLLSGQDQQTRLRTYRLWPDIQVSSLGPNWREQVSGWSEEARTDFVSELLHHRIDGEIAAFAAEDKSVAVKKAAVSGLMWTGDLTYIATDEGWLYLAGLKDLYSGEIVGYAMGERMTRHLVMQALFRAVSLRRQPPGMIHHTGRGSQYCSHEYRALMAQFGMQASMSRRGNCYDNAPIESFWGTLKNELVHHRRYATREQARREIAEYIDVFYNRQRRQARLDYLSPAAFMQQYLQQRTAA